MVQTKLKSVHWSSLRLVSLPLDSTSNLVPKVTRGRVFLRKSNVFVDFNFLFISISANIIQIELLTHIGSLTVNVAFFILRKISALIIR